LPKSAQDDPNAAVRSQEANENMDPTEADDDGDEGANPLAHDNDGDEGG